MRLKQSWTAICLLAVIFFSCSSQEHAVRETETRTVDSFTELSELFSNPPVEYSTAPFWVWNNDVSEQVIDEQIDDMAACGIKRLFIHPRPGLITPYLSDRWHELCKYAADRGKDKGMEIWLYDENSYPSGFAGGHVPAEMPESYNRGQGLVYKKADRIPENSDSEYIIVLKKSGDTFIDITASLDSEKGKTGDYLLFEKAYYRKSPWFGGYSYVDLLLEGVTEKFIEVTMRGYENNLDEHLATTVPGIFTDEPNIAPPVSGSVRWTPALFDLFRERWGYDLETRLPSLFEEAGDWRRVRHNYYGIMIELFIERWSKPWFEYCEEKGIQWTGHYWEHGWPSPHHGGDNMAMYAWHQVPAIDILMNEYREHPNAQFGNVRAVKELISAANQTGRTRTLSETYGAGGWDLRFEDMKRIGEWEYVLGVNFMNQHLSYITIAGARKRDHPQSFSYHEPWWHLYKYQADYFSRLSLALSAGKQINRILVIEPTTTAWMYYSPTVKNEKVGNIGTSFQNLVQNLERLQVEYDIGCENIMKDRGSVSGKKLVVGERSYDIVILPPLTENLDTPTADLMEHYLAAGGTVLSFVEPPSFVDGVESEKLASLARKHSATWKSFGIDDLTECVGLLSEPDFRIDNPASTGGILFHHRRRLEDGQLVFLVNTSIEENAKGEFTSVGNAVHELDPLTGEISPYVCTVQGGKVTVVFDLPPAGSLLLFIANKGTPKTSSTKTALHTLVKPDSDTRISRSAPNTLILDYCDLTLCGKKEENVYFFKAAETIFKHHGFESNPWERAVQFKSDILDKNTFAADSGFIADFHFQVSRGVDTSSLQAVIERPELWVVSINGSPVEANSGEWRLDREFGVYDIGKYVTSGDNIVTLTASPMTVHTELEPIYIFGEFNLRAKDNGWEIVNPVPISYGEFAGQGMPFYSESVSYRKTYTLKAERNYKIKISNWYGAVAEIRVNGKHAGIISWQPFEYDISECVENGRNEVEVLVYGTLKNLLGPHHKNPLRGRAWPHMFFQAPNSLPPGSEYDVIDYGLFEEFELVEEM